MIDYLKSIAKLENVDFKKVEQLIDEFFLGKMKHTKMRDMSKGSLQKVGVIQALMAPHDVILLDEPLSGQDTDSQEVFISKMNELKKQGVTIFMSCHEKKLMDELSDHIYTIKNGKLENLGQVFNSFFKIYVRKNKYVLKVMEAEIKDTVLKLFNEEWELVGIEEYL